MVWAEEVGLNRKVSWASREGDFELRLGGGEAGKTLEDVKCSKRRNKPVPLEVGVGLV